MCVFHKKKSNTVLVNQLSITFTLLYFFRQAFVLEESNLDDSLRGVSIQEKSGGSPVTLL